MREADDAIAQRQDFRNSIAVHVTDTGNAYRCRFETEETLPPFDPDTFDDGYVQIPGVSESSGIELAASVPIGERFELLGNWTDNEARTITNDPRARRPDTLANIGLQYSSTDDRLRILANYRISKDAVDRFSDPLPDYEVLDLSASYALNDKIDLHGRVENLTDADYQEALGFFTAGRSAYAGVRLRF